MEKQPAVEEPSRRLSEHATTSNAEADEGCQDNGAPDDYPHGFRLVILVISLMLAMFLIALDNVSHIHS